MIRLRKISESFATVSTWDGKELYRYEALGRASREEFDNAVKIMDAFIGQKGVFLPKVIIIDSDGKHVETTNRTKLPDINQLKKSQLLGYNLNANNMPLTNPADIANDLDEQFNKSKYCKSKA